MKAKEPLNTESFELRDFPADIQDILKQRAVERCMSIAEVMHDYIVETSQLIAATQSAA